MFVRMPPQAVMRLYAAGAAALTQGLLSPEEELVLDIAAQVSANPMNLGEGIKRALIDALTSEDAVRGLPLLIPTPVREGVIYDEEVAISGGDSVMARAAAWALVSRFADIDPLRGAVTYAGQSTFLGPAEALRLTLISGSGQAVRHLEKSVPGLRLGEYSATYVAGDAEVLITPALTPHKPLKAWATIEVAGHRLRFPLSTGDAVLKAGTLNDLLTELAEAATELIREERQDITALTQILRAAKRGHIMTYIDAGPARILIPTYYPAKIYVVARPGYEEAIAKNKSNLERKGTKTYVTETIKTPNQLRQAIQEAIEVTGAAIAEKIIDTIGIIERSLRTRTS